MVMLALADFCDDRGQCFPGLQRVAFKCRLSVRTVRRIITHLEEIGEVVREIGKGVTVSGQRGVGCTNMFTLVLNCPDRLTPQSSLTSNCPDKNGQLPGQDRSKSPDTAMSAKPSVEPSDNLRGNGRHLPTSGEAKTICEIFKRKLTTPWSDREIRSFRELWPFDQEDLELVRKYYEANQDQPDNICRRDLYTFLNNYNGEVDRARKWQGDTNKKTMDKKAWVRSQFHTYG